MQVKQVIELTGVTKKALEYYENKKLLAPKRLPSGYRDYEEQDLITIKTILLLRQLDFSIEEITQLLNHQQFNLFDEKKRKIERQIYDLQTNLLYLSQTEELLKLQNEKPELILEHIQEERDTPQEIIDTLLGQIEEDRHVNDEYIKPQAWTRQQIGICLLLISLVAGVVTHFALRNDDFYILMYFFSLFLLSDKLYYYIKLLLLEIKEKFTK